MLTLIEASKGDMETLDTIEGIRILPDGWSFASLPEWLKAMFRDGYIDTAHHPKQGFMVAMVAEDATEPVIGIAGEWIVRMYDGAVHWVKHAELERMVCQPVDRASTTLMVKLS